MVKHTLEHQDSIVSYGTEDLAQYKDLPQTTTRIVLGCAGAATNNPYIDTSSGYQVIVYFLFVYVMYSELNPLPKIQLYIQLII